MNLSMMSIAVIGDMCSGKKTVVDFFVKRYSFTILENNYNDKISLENNLETIKLTNSSNLRDKLKNNYDRYIVIYPKFTWEDYLDVKNKSSFRLINVICPSFRRSKNFLNKYPGSTEKDFLKMEESFYKSDNIRLTTEAFVNIINDSTLEAFIDKLEKLICTFQTYFRPSWDDYFMSVAHILADRCNCIKQKVGAVMVKNNRILSTGYNGTPKLVENCFSGGCKRCNDVSIKQGLFLDTCFCLHAEANCVKYKFKLKVVGSR